MTGHMTMGRWTTWIALSLAALLSVGCGDVTASVGKQGRLRFSLGTDYEAEEDELTDATLVAGHKQHIWVDLTGKGEDDIDEPNEITYRMRPDEGAEVESDEGSKRDAPDAYVLARKAGKYELEAVYKGKVFDSISLDFDVPDALEIKVKVRLPYHDDFDDAGDAAVTEVPEGTQATFLPIPKKGKRRLLGDIETSVKATREELVVPGAGASFVYEQSVWSIEGNIDFYFIDPGELTIIITDPVSRAFGEYDFRILDAVP